MNTSPARDFDPLRAFEWKYNIDYVSDEVVQACVRVCVFVCVTVPVCLYALVSRVCVYVCVHIMLIEVRPASLRLPEDLYRQCARTHTHFLSCSNVIQPCKQHRTLESVLSVKFYSAFIIEPFNCTYLLSLSLLSTLSLSLILTQTYAYKANSHFYSPTCL